MNTCWLPIISLVCLTLVSCDGSKHVTGEISRTALSPNGQIEAAVAVDKTGGATVATMARVYLRTESNGLYFEIMKAEPYSHDISVKWVDDNHLIIDAECAQIFSFTNWFDVLKRGELVYQVSVAVNNHGLCKFYGADGRFHSLEKSSL